MQQTEFWEEWHICHVATHRDGAVVTRIGVYLSAFPRFLRNALRRPEIVHFHMSSYGSFYRKSVLIWFSRLLRLHIVLHLHGGEFHKFYAARSAAFRLYIRATVESADVVIALGTVWRERLRVLAPRAKVAIVPNAVRAAASPVSQSVTGDPVRVLFLGDVSQAKGVYDLLDAWGAAFGASSAAHLTIAGHGDLEGVRQRSAELGLEASVELLGWVPQDAVRSLLEGSHVLTLPSHNEGQPMAILEAMAHGLCVVATNTGGIPALIDEECGLLVPVGDSAALAAALRQVVASSSDRTKFGSSAFNRVQTEFDPTVVSRSLDAIYRSVLR